MSELPPRAPGERGYIKKRLPRARPGATLAERFWAKVVRAGNDECWVWSGAITSGGYGIIQLGNQDAERRHKTVGAHRVSYELANGLRVPDDLVVMHKCDNRPCVNPAHLTIGTYGDNSRDCVEKGRSGLRQRRMVIARKAMRAAIRDLDPKEGPVSEETRARVVADLKQAMRVLDQYA